MIPPARKFYWMIEYTGKNYGYWYPLWTGHGYCARKYAREAAQELQKFNTYLRYRVIRYRVIKFTRVP